MQCIVLYSVSHTYKWPCTLVTNTVFLLKLVAAFDNERFFEGSFLKAWSHTCLIINYLCTKVLTGKYFKFCCSISQKSFSSYLFPLHQFCYVFFSLFLHGISWFSNIVLAPPYVCLQLTWNYGINKVPYWVTSSLAVYSMSTCYALNISLCRVNSTVLPLLWNLLFLIGLCFAWGCGGGHG